DVIEGIVPNPYEMPEGCRFHPRCKHAREICKQQQPELIEFQGHQVRCFMYTDHWTEGGK
ncbi:MAG: ABC transporter ATP-binding protein, partial [Bacillota bacterium]|nr:ABC transporter ATP-binding protein [Bacillota bacterium]